MSLASQASPATRTRIHKHWIERGRATIGMLIITPFVCVALFSTLPTEPAWLPAVSTVIGWILFLIGAAFRLWSTLYIGGRKGDALVTEGPYSMTRNPLYIGTLLITLSLAFFLQSLTIAVGIVPAAAIYLYFTVRSEERRLRAKHGVVYDAYCRQVPRLWPSVGLLQSSSLIEVNVRCLALEAMRSLRWLTVPMLAMMLMQLRAESWWPVWFAAP